MRVRVAQSRVKFDSFIFHPEICLHDSCLFFPQAGTWETKVSNREKKKQQQRKKDKGSEDSCSPGGPESPKAHVDTPVVTVTAKKNRGINGIIHKTGFVSWKVHHNNH